MFKKGDIIELLSAHELKCSHLYYERLIKHLGDSLFIVEKDEILGENKVLCKKKNNTLESPIFLYSNFFKLHKSADEIIHQENVYFDISKDLKSGDWVKPQKQMKEKLEIGDTVCIIGSDDPYIIDRIISNFTPSEDYNIVYLKNPETGKYRAPAYLANLRLITKKQNEKSNEVSGSTECNWQGQTKAGRAITSSSRSSIAVGSRLVGNEKRAFSKKSRVGEGQISFSPKFAYGN